VTVTCVFLWELEEEDLDTFTSSSTSSVLCGVEVELERYLRLSWKASRWSYLAIAELESRGELKSPQAGYFL
jgi:hypothetical protein